MLLALLALPGLARADEAALRAACDAPAHAAVLTPSGPAPEARAIWLDAGTLRWPGAGSEGRFRLHHAANGGVDARAGATVRGADGALDLRRTDAPLPEALQARYPHVRSGPVLQLRKADRERLDALLQGQLLLTREDAQGRVLEVAATQLAGALDDRYAAAEAATDLGVTVGKTRTGFALWAPTARAVAVCLYADDVAPAEAVWPLAREDVTGIWRGARPVDLWGRYYTVLVDVFVPGTGLVRNRVTDPYAVSLGADGRRAYVANLADPALAPPGWNASSRPTRVAAQVDQVIYELHVRDFSIGDASVPAEHRGRYLAFTHANSDGMRHLRALADAGVTDVHLLPVFDFATVPETGCVTPAPSGAPDAESQQAAIEAVKDRDCFNWGYDPSHFTAPEGSYVVDAADGAARIREFRRMVQALHGAGLRVGMDVVYNHTSAAGQDPRSVLDRIVPGYYHRLDERGAVTTSTCCANTATEHRMMAKLMIDSAVVWARDHRIDSFRFDLMGHQPRAAMEALKRRVEAAAGRPVELLGEGWNFGEVANGARFVQASQLALAGSGIATFSDRARDAVRGGGPGDADARQVSAQGWSNGLVYDPNAQAPATLGPADLARAADLVRVGLAGSLRDVVLEDHAGRRVTLDRLDYNGQPAGYVAQPGEVVNYVENHDNQTLYDLNAFKLPLATSRDDRARAQVVAIATVAFSQGIAYLHAGVELLRSKSMDRNSYDSGDWFNRIDWRGLESTFGSGLPPRRDNGASWALMRPRLADPALRPAPAEIRWTRDATLDLLRIRSSSVLFRLRDAAAVKARLRFPNSGPTQQAAVVMGRLEGRGLPEAGFDAVLYAINADRVAHTVSVPEEVAQPWVLHPVQRAAGAADARPRKAARYEATTGAFTVPPRTAVVWVQERRP